MTSKILIADKLAPEGADLLRAAGVDVTVKTGLKGDDLVAALAAHDGVAVRSETQLTRPILEQCMKGSGNGRPRRHPLPRRSGRAAAHGPAAVRRGDA